MGINQFGIEMRRLQGVEHRFGDPVDEILRNIDTDKSADADRIERIDNALAELSEVLEKGHRSGGLFHWSRDLRIGFGLGYGFRLDAGCHGGLLGNSWLFRLRSWFRPALLTCVEPIRQPARSQGPR